MADLFVPVVVGGKAVMAIAKPTTADTYVTWDDYESLQSQLAAERERADALQRVVDEARWQKPDDEEVEALIECLEDDAEILRDVDGYEEIPDNMIASAAALRRLIYPVPAQPVAVPECCNRPVRNGFGFYECCNGVNRSAVQPTAATISATEGRKDAN